jgi:large subunit ribosomal protein L31
MIRGDSLYCDVRQLRPFRAADERGDGSLKQGIHPEYTSCEVTCACGEAFTTRSTVAKLHVDICSKCHPFYTGKQKFVDTAGRVEKFQRKFAGNYFGKRP